MFQGRAANWREATLEACIAGVAEGNAAAVDALFARLDPLIRAGVNRFRALPDTEREDMAQRIALWLYEDIDRLCQRYSPSRGGPVGYFNRIIRCHASRHYRDLRAAKRTREIALEEELPDLPDDGPDRLSPVERSAAADDFQRWLDSLKGNDRRIFAEHVLGPATSLEMAEWLGSSEDAVNKRVQRLREALTVWFRKRGWLEVLISLTAFCILAAYHGMSVGIQ